MFIKEKTYFFHGTLERFLTMLLLEHQRLCNRYGSAHFTLDFSGPGSSDLGKYGRERVLVYWADYVREGPAQAIVQFHNLPSLDGDNIKLRADIYFAAEELENRTALDRWEDTESLWLAKGLMKAREDEIVPQQTRKKSGGKRLPQAGTIDALNRLCEIRLEAIKKRRSLPTRLGAIQEAGTTFKTVQTHMPELLARWNDVNYAPQKYEKLE